MSRGNEIITRVIRRAGWALLLHFLIGALLIGLSLWLTFSYTDASLKLRNDTADPLGIRSLLETARGHFMAWILSSLVVSYAATALFLGVSEATRAANAIRGASAQWLWFTLLLAGLGLTCTLFWLHVSRPEAGAALMFGNLAALVSLTGAGVFLAYYLGTALTVPLSMKPSVPLAGLLPKAWN